MKARFFALLATAALCAGAIAPAQAGLVFGGGSAAGQLVWTPDLNAAASYCRSTGGHVQVRTPVYGTNNPPSQQLPLAGSAPFCDYASKGANPTHIWVFLSTLYTTKPTLAALAYYSKPKLSGSCSGNPASCYCSQLGGTDLFGGITAAGGAWVFPGGGTYADLDTCIFPDLSSIDSWGLAYHSNNIIRGIDLSKVLRYHKP